MVLILVHTLVNMTDTWRYCAAAARCFAPSSSLSSSLDESTATRSTTTPVTSTGRSCTFGCSVTKSSVSAMRVHARESSARASSASTSASGCSDDASRSELAVRRAPSDGASHSDGSAELGVGSAICGLRGCGESLVGPS